MSESKKIDLFAVPTNPDVSYNNESVMASPNPELFVVDCKEIRSPTGFLTK